MKRISFALLALAGTLLVPLQAQAVNYGPSPYLSFSDSPFSSVPFTTFYLEDLEDGALNTPGVTVNAGSINAPPSSATDSVDGDDGAIDGNGNGGWSLYSNNALSSFEFSFSAAPLGGLPTHVGIVWTDVGFVTSGDLYAGPVTAEAFNSANQSIGVIGPVALGGDGTVNGSTAEDRFFGFSSFAGISRFVISMSNSVDWEVDHLQYGIALPEPSTGVLVGAALVALGRGRRR